MHHSKALGTWNDSQPYRSNHIKQIVAGTARPPRGQGSRNNEKNKNKQNCKRCVFHCKTNDVPMFSMKMIEHFCFMVKTHTLQTCLFFVSLFVPGSLPAGRGVRHASHDLFGEIRPIGLRVISDP